MSNVNDYTYDHMYISDRDVEMNMARIEDVCAYYGQSKWVVVDQIKLYKKEIDDFILSQYSTKFFENLINNYIIRDLTLIVMSYFGNIYELENSLLGYGYLFNGIRVGKWFTVTTKWPFITRLYIDFHRNFIFSLGNYKFSKIGTSYWGIKDGEWCEVYNKSVFAKENYINNVRHGERNEFNEKLSSSDFYMTRHMNYKSGRLHGKYFEFHENGSVKIIGKYANNNKTGKWGWFMNGNPSPARAEPNLSLTSYGSPSYNSTPPNEIKKISISNKSKLISIKNISKDIFCLYDMYTGNIFEINDYPAVEWSKMIQQYENGNYINEIGYYVNDKKSGIFTDYTRNLKFRYKSGKGKIIYEKIK
ncbi:MAG: hypothetical protein Edafosvirus1_144 [Edafosvirus sp.]|uniref:MORN repeat-containing protein n=1 Tax=Edafosvirus sp. TaxID=2487765 RepID=A0A3G4ZW17_9VIRU|nr:MAG: hypothetical protein Edafosvirus1_144 [Edafosvirus sp.]